MTDDPHQPFTVDGRTRASNPGQLRINYLYWLRSFPQKPVRLLLPLIFLAGIAFFLNYTFAGAVLEKLEFRLNAVVDNWKRAARERN